MYHPYVSRPNQWSALLPALYMRMCPDQTSGQLFCLHFICVCVQTKPMVSSSACTSYVYVSRPNQLSALLPALYMKNKTSFPTTVLCDAELPCGKKTSANWFQKEVTNSETSWKGDTGPTGNTYVNGHTCADQGLSETYAVGLFQQSSSNIPRRKWYNMQEIWTNTEYIHTSMVRSTVTLLHSGMSGWRLITCIGLYRTKVDLVKSQFIY